MPKRVLFICQYFHPETFRGNEIAFDLARRGIDVTVICGTPNYPRGKFFKGYSWFRKTHEIVNGVNVIRLPIIPRGDGSKIQLLANYFSYFTVASFYLPLHLLFHRKYDACFVQQLSPVMMSVPGILFKKLSGRKLITWVLDLWPESLNAAGGINNKKILDFFGWFAKKEYEYSDKILVSSKGFASNIRSKGDFAHKIEFMPNWAEDELQSKEKFDIPEMPDGFRVLFAGNVGEAQDFDNIVKAAKLLSNEDAIRIIIVGDGRKKEWLDQQIIQQNLSDRLTTMGRFDIKYMPSFFQAADCLLLPLKNDKIMNLTVPAKLQAYMNSAKPILGMINGDARDLINEIGCGIGVSASSPDRLVTAMRKLKSMSKEELSDMGEKGYRYSNENFNKEKILNNFYNILLGEDS